MSSGKQDLSKSVSGRPDEIDAPPSYDDATPGPSTRNTTEESSAPRNEKSQSEKPGDSSLPTIDAPFNFPSESECPPYSESRPIRRPVAIPQIRPDPATPFLLAYAPSLLSRGITASTWLSFLETMNAFLTANVSDRALSHAADMAKHVGAVPKSFGKGVAAHAKSVGDNIKDNAKRGNVLGAAFGVVTGSISLPIGTALSAVGHVAQLPFATVGAVARKPQTPRERAGAYAAAANKDWFHARGLHAQLVNSVELAELAGISATQLLETVSASEDRSAEGQLNALRDCIEELEIRAPASTTLEIGGQTLWLVITQEGRDPK
ncbi:MAG: hypothetical protein Q9227_005103 [Pyrenula ochraceoflavens]